MAVIDRLNVNQTPAFLKDGVFDISEYNNGAVYTDLSDALGQNGINIPPTIRKGGMSVKFIQSNDDHKYVQYRLVKNAWSNAVSDWQSMNVDDDPKYMSDNLVTSGAVFEELGGETVFDLFTTGNVWPCPFLQKGNTITSIGTLGGISLLGTGLNNKSVKSNDLPWTIDVNGYEKIAGYTSPARHENIAFFIPGLKSKADTIIFDVSKFNNAQYSTPSAAFTAVPVYLRKPGMFVKYINSNTGQYSQYFFILSTFDNTQFTSESFWRKVDNVSSYLNVNNLLSQTAAFDDITTARLAVSQKYRNIGTIISYLHTSGWRVEQFIGTSYPSTDGMWTSVNNWLTLNHSGKYNYYKNKLARTQDYSDGLHFIVFNPLYVSDSDLISAKCYSNKLYISINSTYVIRELSFDNINNDEVIPITQDNNTIGYICFRDKTKWTANSFTGLDYLENSKITKLNIVTSIQILNDAVTRDKIANNAVTENKIASNAVSQSKIQDSNYLFAIKHVASNFPDYFNDIKEIYIPDSLSLATKIGIFCSPYGNAAFFFTVNDRLYGARSAIPTQNDVIYEFKIYYNADQLFPDNTVVAYVIFKDYNHFASNTTQSNPNNLNLPYCNDIKNCPQIAISLGYYGTDNAAVQYIAQSLNETQKEQARINIGAAQKVNLHITIPNKVYAVVGTELNIWNDTVSRSIDRGLQSPLNYYVNWACAKGMITERGFRFTPQATDVGTTYATCYIYDLDNNLIESKQFAIVVKAKDALNAAKNIAFFGASLGRDTCSNLYTNFTNSNKFTGTIPAMVGTRGTGDFHYDAVGGYTWRDYATSGRYCYRIFVEGVTALEVGATYDLNIDGTNVRFSIIEVNTSSGTGNVLLENGYGSRVPDFPTSGTLTKVSGGGDDSVAFDNTGHSDGGEQPNNPLWNSNTNQLDVALYKQRVGLQPTDKIDAVAFQFGGNDHAVALDIMQGYIIDLYNAFISDNPNCKFIIELPTVGGNTVNGAGTNYGAGFSVPQFKKDIYNINQLYLSLAVNATYPNIRICTAALEIDRYYGYNLVNRAISQRYSTNEKVHNNFLHPGESGYGQISDAYFAAYIGVLTE